MHTLKQNRSNNAIHHTFPFFKEFHIFRTDDYIDVFVRCKSSIYTRERTSEDFHQTILRHHTVNDITLTNKISYKRILRFVVNIYRRTHLLDQPLVHNNDPVRHGQCFFLIVSYKNKSNTQFIFYLNQLLLHVLTQLQIQCSQRLIQKQHFRLIYNSTGNGNTLLLSTGQRHRMSVFKPFQIYKFQCISDLILNI